MNFDGFSHPPEHDDATLEGIWTTLLGEWRQTDSDSLWCALHLIKELANRLAAAEAWNCRTVAHLMEMLQPDLPLDGTFELRGEL